MGRALELARGAAEAGEAPIGCVIVDADGVVVAEAANAPIASHDPTAHAEIVALRAAAAKLGNYRLKPGLTLYVTLEPCAMCAGAISHARIARVVYGAEDAKGGGVAHGARVFDQPTCHWKPDVSGGVRAEESAELLRSFFKARR
ncbi:MAG: tRNA adenosine(34) deaminase TadA [Pseudomonadota bacterium]